MGLRLAVLRPSISGAVEEGAFGNILVLDNFALFFTQVFLAVAALTILSAMQYVRELRIHEGEFYALVLFATSGMILMAGANDLIIFFLALETMSIAVYVLTGIWRGSARSAKRRSKYFLMGAFATGFLLYGIALIYGAAGSTNLNQISAYLQESSSDWPVYLVGGGFLLLIGLRSKPARCRSTSGLPDVYEGAPTPVTGMMAVAVKAQAFAAWARILMHKLAPWDSDWAAPVWVLCIATMTIGNLLALTQSSVERMLAYSSASRMPGTC